MNGNEARQAADRLDELFAMPVERSESTIEFERPTGTLGFDGVNSVRQGKVIELDLADGTTEAQVTEMCEKLLANTVIESYRVDMG